MRLLMRLLTCPGAAPPRHVGLGELLDRVPRNDPAVGDLLAGKRPAVDELLDAEGVHPQDAGRFRTGDVRISETRSDHRREYYYINRLFWPVGVSTSADRVGGPRRARLVAWDTPAASLDSSSGLVPILFTQRAGNRACGIGVRGRLADRSREALLQKRIALVTSSPPAVRSVGQCLDQGLARVRVEEHGQLRRHLI